MDFEILEHLPDAVVVTGSEGLVAYANAAAEKLFGYGRSEILGQPVESLVPERFRAGHLLHRQAYSSAPRARPLGAGLELWVLKKDGREFPAEIALAPLHVGPGWYTMAVVRDATERKRIEEHERRLESAEEEIRQLDEVLTVASHELRAPVVSMQLQLAALQRGAAEAAPDLDLVRERLARVGRAAQRLSRLVEDLLDTGQIRFGKLRLKPEEVDLAEVAREVVGTLREEVERTGSQLTLRAGGPVPGRWDPVRIGQVIANLLANAAKFGAGKPITVAVEGDGELGRVIVADQGIGIAPEHHKRIFERYERGETAGAAGLGLGLYIARQIVQAHGGSIRLRSALGAGSEFRVELPRAIAES